MQKYVILDTDIGPDCDDAAALAILNVFADRGMCEISAVIHCTSNPYGAGCVDAICRYYGRPDMTIGTWPEKGFLDEDYCMKYNRNVTQEYENRYKESQPEDAVTVYRKALAEKPDKSVEIIAIGPLNCVSALLDSPADDISPLTGKELVEKKVTKLTMMAGMFRHSDPERARLGESFVKTTAEEYREYNVICDIAAARNVAANWPTPKSYCGIECGFMRTGATLKPQTYTNPVKRVFELYSEKDALRESFDPMTVIYALDPGSGLMRDSQPGIVRFDEQGHTVFTPDPEGQDHFAEMIRDEAACAAYMDELLAIIPGC